MELFSNVIFIGKKKKPSFSISRVKVTLEDSGALTVGALSLCLNHLPLLIILIYHIYEDSL